MEEIISIAQERIRTAVAEHEEGLIEFSGGKDSLAVLHLALPVKDKLKVLFVDTGDTFPHVMEFVVRTCEELGYSLEIVKPPVPVLEGIEQNGMPCDVLPMWAHPIAVGFLPYDRRPSVLLRTALECCAQHLYFPLQESVKRSAVSLVVRGSKGTDVHITLPDGSEVEGIEYVSPLWLWSDDEVMAYLHRQGVLLPLQYRHGCMHSLDCARCTAWGGTEAELQRVKFTKEVYPEIYADWKDRMTRIHIETQRQLEAVAPFFQLAQED